AILRTRHHLPRAVCTPYDAFMTHRFRRLSRHRTDEGGAVKFRFPVRRELLVKMQSVVAPLRVELDARFGASLRRKRRETFSPKYAFDLSPVGVIAGPFRADQLEFGEDETRRRGPVDDDEVGREIPQD